MKNQEQTKGADMTFAERVLDPDALSVMREEEDREVLIDLVARLAVENSLAEARGSSAMLGGVILSALTLAMGFAIGGIVF